MPVPNHFHKLEPSCNTRSIDLYVLQKNYMLLPYINKAADVRECEEIMQRMTHLCTADSCYLDLAYLE